MIGEFLPELPGDAQGVRLLRARFKKFRQLICLFLGRKTLSRLEPTQQREIKVRRLSYIAQDETALLSGGAKPTGKRGGRNGCS